MLAGEMMSLSDAKSVIGPHGHDFTDLANCLQSFSGERLVYLPNPGNAGDALIALGTYKFFDFLGLDVEIGDHEKSYDGRIVIYGGGGSLISNYPKAAEFISRTHAVAESFVLLPATVRAHPDMLSHMGLNCHIFAREQSTLEYIASHRSNAEVTLSHDLAFFMDDASIRQNNWDRKFLLDNGRWWSWLKMAVKFSLLARSSEPTLSALRIDSEATDIDRPKQNHDLSHYFKAHNIVSGQMDPDICATTIKMMRLLMVQHKKIRTNRLHLAILGAISGIEVEMLPNSYDKNLTVFEHSLADFFPNVTFMRQTAREHQIEGGSV